MTLSQLEHARAQLDRARAAMAAGLADLAAMHIQASLHRCPDFAPARLAEADLCLMRNDPKGVLAALDCLDLYDPEHRDAPQIQFLRAEALIRAGHDQQAGHLLDQLAEQYPDDVRPHRLHAGLAMKLGQVGDAIVHLRRVQRLAPSDAAARRLLSELLAQRDPQAAIEALDATAFGAAAGEGEDARATLLTLARLYRRAGRERDAQDLYAQLLRENPGDAALWTEAGILADDLGDDRLAVIRLHTAVRSAAAAANAAALSALARAHQHAGRFRSAARCWFRLARLRERAEIAAKSATILEAKAGLLVSALEAGRQRLLRRIQKDLATHSSPQERRRALAIHWSHTALGRVIHLIRNPVPVAAPLSPLAGLLQNSTKTLQAHAGQFPGRADSQYYLALCQQAAGDSRGARQSVNSALAINPRYAAARRLADRLNPAPRLAA
jgi:tetratricopeptide (TPR) repeat protein